MFFMNFQQILPGLLTPNNYCFHNQVIPAPDWLGVVDQTFSKLDMVYSDFVWLPLYMVSVLIWIHKNMVTTKLPLQAKKAFAKNQTQLTFLYLIKLIFLDMLEREDNRALTELGFAHVTTKTENTQIRVFAYF